MSRRNQRIKERERKVNANVGKKERERNKTDRKNEREREREREPRHEVGDSWPHCQREILIIDQTKMEVRERESQTV